MRKLVISLLTALCVGQFATAQEGMKVTTSEPYKTSWTTDYILTGQIGEKVYMIYGSSKEKKMLIYNSNLELQKEVEIQARGGDKRGIIGKDFSYRTAMFFEDGILCFFETYEKSSKSRMLLCQRLDTDGNFVGDLTLIDQIQANKKSNSGSFMLESSEDNTKFLVVQNEPYDKKADEKFILKTFDGKLNKLAEKEVSLPYMDKNASVSDYYLSNRGDVYLMVEVDKEKSEKVKGEDDSFFILYCVNLSKDGSLSEFKVELPSKAIKRAALRIDNESNTVMLSGFYSDIKTRASSTRDIDGFFSLSIDMAANKLLTQGYKELSNEIINQLRGKKADAKVKEGKGIDLSFSILDYIRRPDGSSIIVAEKNFISQVTHCNQYGACYTIYYYNNHNIFLIGLSATGEVQAFYDIPKRQTVSGNGMYNSVSIMEKDGKIVFLYNDNKKNATRDIKTFKDAKVMNNPQKAVLTAVEFSGNGDMRGAQIPLDKKMKPIPTPRYAREVSKGVYIVPAIKRGGIALLKFEL
ncbi:MAG: hypothetical protein LBR81_05915 [Prevotellaceae bacterium]|nr:hypothetical protein [Prevotellaceae bacterium]